MSSIVGQPIPEMMAWEQCPVLMLYQGQGAGDVL